MLLVRFQKLLSQVVRYGNAAFVNTYLLTFRLFQQFEHFARNGKAFRFFSAPFGGLPFQFYNNIPAFSIGNHFHLPTPPQNRKSFRPIIEPRKAAGNFFPAASGK